MLYDSFQNKLSGSSFFLERVLSLLLFPLLKYYYGKRRYSGYDAGTAIVVVAWCNQGGYFGP